MTPIPANETPTALANFCCHVLGLGARLAYTQ